MQRKPSEAILANPPFLPNPRGIGSQCSAKFGDGGPKNGDKFREASALREYCNSGKETASCACRVKTQRVAFLGLSLA